jgi:hypothetical protein
MSSQKSQKTASNGREAQTSLEALRHRYLELVNEVLPAQAQSRQFPVRFNHCFARIILDNLFGRCWYEVIDRRQGAAYRQLTREQLEDAIALAQTIIDSPDSYLEQLNRNSLAWRGK